MSPKFGMQVDFDLPNRAKLLRTKSEVELPRGVAILKNWCGHNSVVFIQFGRWTVDMHVKNDKIGAELIWNTN